MPTGASRTGTGAASDSRLYAALSRPGAARAR